MPPQGWAMLTIRNEAKDAFDQAVLALIIRDKKRYTVSQAVEIMARAITSEISPRCDHCRSDTDLIVVEFARCAKNLCKRCRDTILAWIDRPQDEVEEDLNDYMEQAERESGFSSMEMERETKLAAEADNANRL
jgi:hypothetical protein